MVLSAIIFLLKLDKFRTKHGITSLQLLQAFMKTWVAKHPSELETYFEIYSKMETVQTKIFHFLSQGRKITLILPGIHPGPFYPVGSYNLSEAIFQTLNENSIPMILHGTGGHERNLPKNEYTNLYATKLGEFVRSLIADKSEGLKGPLRRKFGNTTITILALGNQVLTMISKAPYNSDDLDPKIINSAMAAASEHNLDLALVDAHNSIGGENAPSEEIRKEDWGALFDNLISDKEQGFKVGYAHSSEIGFTHNSDISDAGIGVLLIATDAAEGALVAVDSNNARVGLREKLNEQLGRQGIELIELCTSDTHNLAARSLVSRGYFALGEATSTEQIIKGIMELVHIAQQRTARCKYTIADFSIDIPLTGIESLNDFALLTNSVIGFTKNYFKKIIPLMFVMLGITLFY
jgi:putative membrane protein